MFYKRIASADDPEGLAAIRAEMEDRYGHLPEQGVQLFRLAELRLLAQRLGVRAVEYVEGVVQVKFDANASVDAERLVALIGSRAELTLTAAGLLRLPHAGPPPGRLESALHLLKGMV